MTERPKTRGSRYDRSKQPSKPTKKSAGFGWLKKILLLTVLGFGFVLASYLGYLDYNVRKQFEGKRWAIPARVYANPVELYAGYKLPSDKFIALLDDLHYRNDDQLDADGTYYQEDQQITVKTREFTFWDQKQPSLTLRITFNEEGIASLVDVTQNQDLAIVRMDPVQIGSLYPSIKEDRILIKLEDAPNTLVKGLLASEDRDFYSHIGVSFRGIARALLANMQAGGMVQGGSTITQQLVKNFYLSSERRLSRKIKEALMSFILEYRYSKNEILEAYLNEIYLGQDGASAVHGFGLASEFYFGSTLKDLPLEHIASLVALVRGPSEYDPRRFPERALQRRNLVLDEMQAEGYITLDEADTAKAQPLNVIANTHRASNRYPGFMDLVKRQLKQDYKEEDLTSEGLHIFTTLDTLVQDAVEQAAEKKLAQLEKLPKANDLQTAVVVTRRDNGEIAALVSGRDNTSSGFNRALDAVRPIGSLIKPFIYLTALQNSKKYTITTRVNDSSIVVHGADGKDWMPKNYDHKEHGSVALHTALAKSYNLATVRVGMDVGVAKIVKTLRSMGITRPMDLYPSFLLGAAQLTPMEVTQMYQTLAGDGFSTPIKGIRSVLSAEGKPLQSYPLTVKQAVDPGATYIVNTMMQEVMRSGTASSVYKTFPGNFNLVGKTGTTNDAKDSWFAGYSGDYLAVVWLGRDDNQPAGLTGANGALPIWTALMREISTQPVELNAPDNIKKAWVNPFSGVVTSQACDGSREYPYIAGSQPSATGSCDSSPPENEDKSWIENLFSE